MAIDAMRELDQARDAPPALPFEVERPRPATVAVATFALAGISVAVILPLTALAARYLLGAGSALPRLLVLAIATVVLAFAACAPGQDRTVRLLHSWVSRLRSR